MSSRLITFHYFGSKHKLCVDYPRPQHETLIEPFSGSAAFSCFHHKRRVILFDKDPRVVGAIDYLIKATPEEVMKLPMFYGKGVSVDDFKIPQEAKWLIGYWLGIGSTVPRKSRSAWARKPGKITQYWGEEARSRCAFTAKHIKHWKIFNKGWEEIDVAKYNPACWFVDPPYQEAGKAYAFGAKGIDFAKLGDWCRSLPGQVIVCENRGANWLPFRDFYMARANGYNKGGRVEVVWTKGCPKVGFGLLRT